MGQRPQSPLGFVGYVAILLATMAALIVRSSSEPAALSHNITTWILLTALFAATEALALFFYDEKVRWGFSSGEAILLPMLVALTDVQVIIGAAVAMGVARATAFRTTPLKETFNAAQYGVAAGIAAAFWSIASDGSGTFTTRNAAAATTAVISFAVMTHVFVALGFHLAKRGRFLEAVTSATPELLVNLAGNITLGLFFAAAWITAPWTMWLFPLPLAALYIGYRAVVSQIRERERIEKLHAASQALAGAPDLGRSLRAFLGSVTGIVSAQDARVLLNTDKGTAWTGISAGEITADLKPLENDSLEWLLEQASHSAAPLLLDTQLDSSCSVVPAAPGSNMMVAPLVVEGDATGCLVVQERAGAGQFGDADARLLQALANELSLAIGSRRLSGEVSIERERFRLMVDAVKDYAIFMLDTDGCVISWNDGAARITGYAADEITGQHVSRFYPSDAKGHDWKLEMESALREGTSEFEGWRVRKDGTRFYAQILISPVWDSDGELQGFAKIVRNITEQMQASEERESLQLQLHQAQKMETVGRLAGGIAHDFNNLLSVMLNYSRFVMDAVKDDKALSEDVAEIKTAAERAAALTRQLLIFSRREIPAPHVVDLNEVVVGVEKLLKGSIGEDVVLATRLTDQLDSIKADPGQIEQILLNLAINARDAMAGGGTITITTNNEMLDASSAATKVGLAVGPHVKLTVSDTGCGMPADVRERAFEPFFTTKPKETGTGLGLATVYGIIQQSKGHISVESVEGVGTTFTMWFPATAERTQPVPAERSLVDGRGETVMIVEDQAAVREVARRILANHGYQVLEAENGREALAAASNQTGSVRLLLSDVVMPHMSGMELSQRMSKLIPNLKVLYMSGYSDALVPSGALVEDDVDLLQKPFTEIELLAKVREVLDS